MNTCTTCEKSKAELFEKFTQFLTQHNYITRESFEEIYETSVNIYNESEKLGIDIALEEVFMSNVYFSIYDKAINVDSAGKAILNATEGIKDELD